MKRHLDLVAGRVCRHNYDNDEVAHLQLALLVVKQAILKFICLHNDATSINLFVYQLLPISLMSSGRLHTPSDTKDRNTDAWHEGLGRPSSASELFLMSLPGPSPPAFSICTSRTGQLAGIEFALAWGTIPDRAHPLRHSLSLNSIFTV